jgi:hypothetical protein
MNVPDGVGRVDMEAEPNDVSTADDREYAPTKAQIEREEQHEAAKYDFFDGETAPVGYGTYETAPPAPREENTAIDEKTVDLLPADPLHSDHAAPIMGHDTAPEMAQKASTMTLTLKSLNAKGTQALYTGAHSVIRIAVGNFAGKIAPATLDNFDALQGPREKKVKLTKEERAALPKPTAAEKIRLQEARLAKQTAKLAADKAKLAAL